MRTWRSSARGAGPRASRRARSRRSTSSERNWGLIVEGYAEDREARALGGPGVPSGGAHIERSPELTLVHSPGRSGTPSGPARWVPGKSAPSRAAVAPGNPVSLDRSPIVKCSGDLEHHSIAVSGGSPPTDLGFAYYRLM